MHDQTTRTYFVPTGTSAEDGTASDQPMKKVAQVFDTHGGQQAHGDPMRTARVVGRSEGPAEVLVEITGTSKTHSTMLSTFAWCGF